ncbi:MAG: porin family protein [Prevotella sp.]|uniref:porin family protein n=1 Tax=Prevotella sp. TaxID=59823 RepID=UPI002A341CEC|nr:porin family protein [Prevotella sp.]MDD7317583.1 porin family protein [Prevotellaceae bacterium]MDY4020570.1 porin family protein [Prevotella sp.]
MIKEDWTSRLRERLEGHSAPAPEGLWQQIERRLPKNVKPGNSPLRRWLSAAAAILLVLGVGLSLFWKGDKTIGDNAKTGNITLQNDTYHGAENVPGALSPADIADDMAAQTTASGREQISFSVGNKNYILQTETVDGKPVTVTVRVEDKINADKEVACNSSSYLSRKDDGQRLVRRNSYSVMPKSFEPIPRFRHRFTASLAASGLAMTDLRSSNGIFVNPVMLSGYGNGNNGGADGNPLPSQLYLSGYEERTEHKAPFAIGVRLGYDITPRMWVESGLQYSKLSSTFVREISGNEFKAEQSLHYVGVPLAVGYRLLDVGRLSFYGVAGAQADFNVKSDNSVDGVKSEPVRDNVQFSANASLGAQFKLTPQLGIYVEPGARYYFDNGSYVDNYFKDKKLNFNLQVGARWNIGKK